MKTLVRVRLDDAYAEKRYTKGEKGYIGGYVTDKSGEPLAAVILGKRLVFIQPYALEVISKWRLIWKLRYLLKI